MRKHRGVKGRGIQDGERDNVLIVVNARTARPSDSRRVVRIAFGLHAISRYSPIRGPEIIGVPADIYGVLWFFAVLAYPERSDLKHRENFVKALHSWRCKNVRKGLVNWDRLSSEIRKMPNKSIHGKLNMGFKRIEKRLQAGFIAHSICADGRSVTEVLQDILSPSNQPPGWRYDECVDGRRIIQTDALENHRKSIWTASLPVLHIATSLEFNLWSPLDSSDSMWAKLHRLLHDPCWLPNALLDAEDWRRRRLAPRLIPSFNREKALRLLPADLIPAD